MNKKKGLAPNNTSHATDKGSKKLSVSRTGLPIDVVEGLRKGNIEAFEKVYTHMGGPVEDFLTVLVRSREDARELTQDVFMKIWENHHKIESGRNLKSYIFTLSKFYALDYLKHRKVAAKYVDSMIHTSPSLDYGAEDIVVAEETQLLLRMALDAMPESQRRAFEMSHFEGKPYEEIAETLNLTKATVQVYASNAMKELKKVVHMFNIIFMI